MYVDINTFIGLGGIGLLAFLVRGHFSVREDIRAIKVVLGMNGHPAIGLVTELKEAKRKIEVLQGRLDAA